MYVLTVSTTRTCRIRAYNIIYEYKPGNPYDVTAVPRTVVYQVPDTWYILAVDDGDAPAPCSMLASDLRPLTEHQHCKQHFLTALLIRPQAQPLRTSVIVLYYRQYAVFVLVKRQGSTYFCWCALWACPLWLRTPCCVRRLQQLYTRQPIPDE